MTAADYQNLADEAKRDTLRAEGVTEQVRITGLTFDYDAPLPDLHIRHARSWEPAARRFRDLIELEKENQ